MVPFSFCTGNTDQDSRWSARKFSFSQSGSELEMSSQPPLQCLFCNHLNPAGASFCNDCGSQMHLQPCDRCGAINKRTARACHKCDAGFTLPAAPAPEPTPEPAPSPAVHDNQLAYPVLNNVGVVNEYTLQPASRRRRSWRVAMLVLLLAAIAISGQYYFEQSAAFPKTQHAIPFDPLASGTPTASDVTPVPSRATSKPADPAVSMRSSSTPDIEVKARHDSPIFKECPESVAALGLCNPTTKQENR